MKILLTGAYKYTEGQLSRLKALGADFLYVEDEREELSFDRHLTLLTLTSLRSALEKAGFKTNFCRMPLFTAMPVHAASNAMRSGDEGAKALPQTRMLRLRFLLLALRQHWCLQNAEFHTVIATR